MSDSLDPVRHMATGAAASANEILLATALLKLADELVDLRSRTASLEVDRMGHTRQLEVLRQRVDILELDNDTNTGVLTGHRDRLHHLELDRDETARLGAATSQSVIDIANILGETIDIATDINQRIANLHDVVRNIDGRVGQLEGL